MAEPTEDRGHSRRTFLKVAGTAALLAAVPAGTVILTREGPDGVPIARAFDLYYEPDVLVWMNNGREFRVEVRRGGEVIEAFDGVTIDTFGDLRSDHFRITEVDPPAPA